MNSTGRHLGLRNLADHRHGALSRFQPDAGVHQSASAVGYFRGHDQLMAARERGGPSKTLVSNAPAAASVLSAPVPQNPAGLPDEIGVYYRGGEQWVALPPEIVNWKTGGVVKTVGTLGVVKGDLKRKTEERQQPYAASEPVLSIFWCTRRRGPESRNISFCATIRMRESSAGYRRDLPHIRRRAARHAGIREPADS